MGEQAQGGHALRREPLRLQHLKGPVRVLHHVVEEGGDGTHLVVHLLGQVEGVEHAGHPALVQLAVVGLIGDVHGPFRPLRVDHQKVTVSPICIMERNWAVAFSRWKSFMA